MNFRLSLLLAFAAVSTIPAVAASQPARAGQPDLTIDGATRARVLSRAVDVLNRSYVFPDVARKMEEAVRAKEKAGGYEALASAAAFARALTDDLQAVSQDKHLRVTYSHAPVPPDGEGFEPPRPAGPELDFIRSVNFGFEKLERLPGNIGYLELRAFNASDLAGPTAAAAMTFLAETDALIVDLRRNGGGDSRMVALLASYFFDTPTHLNSLHWREGGRVEESWTSAEVAGRRYGGEKPVYVLTSDRTFSGAEEFAYDLQTRKRATVVGANSGGGAHPGGPRRLDDHFAVWVPAGRAVNPVTKTNWEGVGVAPDHAVPADDALRAAQVLALRALLPGAPAPRAALLRQRAEELDATRR
ncbi:MAG: S41 family peptidase [Vicinamibacteria bacterium]